MRSGPGGRADDQLPEAAEAGGGQEERSLSARNMPLGDAMGKDESCPCQRGDSVAIPAVAGAMAVFAPAVRGEGEEPVLPGPALFRFPAWPWACNLVRERYDGFLELGSGRPRRIRPRLRYLFLAITL